MTELNKETNNDEISLIELFAVLWQRKIMIIVITLIGAIGSIVFSLISIILPPERSPLPNMYTPRASMIINDSSSQGGGMSAMLNSSGLGSLAGLIGANIRSGSTFSDLAIHLIGSNSLLDAVVDEFDLITRYTIDPDRSPRAKSRRALSRLLVAEKDEKSGVFTIEFTDRDPAFAKEVVNFCVLFLERRFEELGIDRNMIEARNLEINIQNAFEAIQSLEREIRRLGVQVDTEGNTFSVTLNMNMIEIELEAQREVYTQLRIQYEMLRVTMASESPVFQILELAEIPDQKSVPSRGLICVIVTFAAGFFAVFLAFALNAIDNIKSDPVAMAKLKRARI